MPADVDDSGEPLPPRDHAGCAIAAARAGCGMALIQILMALAILFAAVFSLIFFR